MTLWTGPGSPPTFATSVSMILLTRAGPKTGFSATIYNKEEIFAPTDLYQRGSSWNIPGCLLDLVCSRNDRHDQANCQGVQKRGISPGSWLHGHPDRTAVARPCTGLLAPRAHLGRGHSLAFDSA